MILEIMQHAFALDIAWLISLVLDNLLWIFMFAAVGFYFFEGKSFLKFALFVPLAVICLDSLLGSMGWVAFTAGFVVAFYLAQIVLLTFFSSNPFFEKRIVWLEIAFTYSLVFYFNVFAGWF